MRVEEDGWIFGRFRRVCPAKSNGRRTSPKLVRASTSVARCIPACGTTPRGVAQRASRCVCKPFAPFSRAKSRAIYTRITCELYTNFLAANSLKNWLSKQYNNFKTKLRAKLYTNYTRIYVRVYVRIFIFAFEHVLF